MDGVQIRPGARVGTAHYLGPDTTVMANQCSRGQRSTSTIQGTHQILINICLGQNETLGRDHRFIYDSGLACHDIFQARRKI